MIVEDSGNDILQEDAENLAKSFPYVSELRDAVVLVTGSTGLIGSHLVKALACMNRIHSLNLKVLASCRSREKAAGVFGQLLERGDVSLVSSNDYQEDCQGVRVDYVIHCACPTGSKYFVEHPVETVAAILDGTRYALDFAVASGVKGFVCLSSLEVYGVPSTQDGRMRESDYGYLDPMSVRSSYSEGKRMAECICAAYTEEYGVPVKVARLSQTLGPGVSYDDKRVFAEFIRCALEGRDIVLHTAGNTLRTYCYTRDAVAGILTILLKGEAGQAYNVSNKETGVTIKEMAELVCGLYPEKNIKVQFDFPEDIESFGYNPEMIIRLETEKLESLGWQPAVGLEEMFARLAKGIVH